MKTLKQIKEELFKLGESESAEIEKTVKEINNSDEVIKKLSKEVELAQSNYDGKAFSEAKDKLQTAMYIKEMQTNKLEELKTTPLLTNEEYGEYINQIKLLTDELVKENALRILPLFDQMKTVKDKEVEIIIETNKLYRYLQNNVVKNYEPYKYSSNGGLMSDRIELEYKLRGQVNSSGIVGHVESIMASSALSKEV